MEKVAGVGREREILPLLLLEVLYLLLLRFHLLTQWLDDRIGQNIACLGRDLRRVLATAGDGADDRSDSTAAD